MQLKYHHYIKSDLLNFVLRYDHPELLIHFIWFTGLLMILKLKELRPNNMPKSHMDMSALDTEKKSDIANKHDIKQFTYEMIQYFEKNLPYIFKKQRDLNVAYSIIELMKKIDDIENFNKKSLYILIREMTDVNTSHITSVVNTLKKHYKKIFNEYFKTGNIIIDKHKKFF